jgi:nucleoid-associated protein YgaU
MTRDVKVGLLLGLGFIFMIAFVINGLPSLRGSRDSNELTRNWVESPSKPPGIGARERKFINRTESINSPPYVAQDSLLGDTGVRIRMPLPQGPSDVQAEKSSNDKVSPGNKGAVEDTTVVVKNIEPVKPAFPKTYVVTEGDNLALIATKFYGEEEGNKRANITKIFDANRNLLKTADEIQVGQELVIPAPQSLTSDSNKGKGILSGPLFKKVISIGREHLSSDKARQSEASKLYTVRDGDSLWRIASEQLGDGSRYTEVAKLNADVLSDEDSLTVGMSLKMPDK